MRLSCFVAHLFLVGLASVAPAATRQPNILVIVADDLGWGDVGFHSGEMPTPRLNRLAKEGAELGRFYVHPLCSPTRAALLTGQCPRRHGIVGAIQGRDAGLPTGLPTLPAMLRTAGYQTSLIGKWHLGRTSTPQQQGFDHFYGFLSGEIDYYAHTNMRGTVDWQRDGKSIEEKGYSTDLLADDAARQIKNRDKTKPFYLQVAFNAPHIPLAAPAELIAKHKAAGEKAGLYRAVVESMDLAIGRILDALDREGLRSETLVIFLSDNGGAVRNGGNNAPLRGSKDTVWEGGIRTPALVRWPDRVPAGAVLTQPIAAQDLFPTLAAVAGAKPPTDVKLDGTNQLPQLLSGKIAAREPILIASYDIALIDGDWKLIESQTDSTRQLYNLKSDPSEKTDVGKANPETLTRLGAILDTLKKTLPAAPTRTNGPGLSSGGRRTR